MQIEVTYQRPDGVRETTLCWDLDDLSLILEGLRDEGSTVLYLIRIDGPIPITSPYMVN